MPDTMTQRSILITGCSSGIGLASALEMKARGWRVFATARKPEDISRLRDQHGLESLYLDYAEPDSIAAAAALFLVGMQPGGHLHIQHILSGSLLWTDGRDVLTGAIAFSAVGFCLYLVRKPLMSLSESYRHTRSKGAGAIFWDFVFYLLIGLVITFSVQMGGVVLVFAYLIIPATISAVFTSQLRIQLIIIWIAAIAASISGLLFAYYLDFSVGPAIALLLGIELIIAAVIGKLIRV